MDIFWNYTFLYITTDFFLDRTLSFPPTAIAMSDIFFTAQSNQPLKHVTKNVKTQLESIANSVTLSNRTYLRPSTNDLSLKS